MRESTNLCYNARREVFRSGQWAGLRRADDGSKESLGWLPFWDEWTAGFAEDAYEAANPNPLYCDPLSL